MQKFQGKNKRRAIAVLLTLILVFTMIITPLFGLLFPITTELITKKDTKKFGLLQHVMYTYFGVFALVIA